MVNVKSKIPDRAATAARWVFERCSKCTALNRTEWVGPFSVSGGQVSPEVAMYHRTAD